MPRKNLFRSDLFPYHVTARANNREPFPVDPKVFWKIATEEIYLLHVLYCIRVHAFVLMPNHFHLLITVPEADLGKIMNLFIANLTKRVNIAAGRSGHVFGGPYFWSIIASTRYFGHVFKYVYRNPVKGGLVEKVEDYPYSTLAGLAGNAALPFPILFTKLGLEIGLPDPEHYFELWLEWLNQPFPKEAEVMIQKLMKRKRIDEILTRTSRRPCAELSRFI